MFTSDSSNGSRFLWHPAVHEWFDEQCFIYLVSGAVKVGGADGETFSQSVRDLLRGLGIYSATVHVVYGSYDALIRFWATQAARQRFVDAIKTSRVEFDTVREFTATDIIYRLANQQQTQTITLSESAAIRQRIGDNLNVIERVASSYRFGHRDASADPADDDLAQLAKLELIVPIVDVPGVKFYMFFSHGDQRSAISDRLVVRSLDEAVAKADVSNVSLYEGNGFASYILKAVARDYESMLPAVNQIRRGSKMLGLVPWTLPIADYGRAPVGETLDASVTKIPREVDRFIDQVRLADEVRSNLRSAASILKPTEVSELNLILRDAQQQLHAEDLQWMWQIVAAAMLRDRKEFNKSLSFLTSLEEDLRDFVPRLLSSLIGRDWVNELKERGRSSSRASSDWVERSPSKWMLNDLLQVLALAAEDQTVEARLSGEFPDGWRSRIRDIVQLRDGFAHGAIYKSAASSDFSGEWGQLLRTVIVGINMQTALEKFNSRFGQAASSGNEEGMADKP